MAKAIATARDSDVLTEAEEWLSLIEAARRDLSPYSKRCDKVRQQYRYDAATSGNARKYQLFWANIETMKPAVFAKTPKATVDVRFKTNDPIARIASMMLERTIQFQFDVNDYTRALKQVRDDYLLYARGVPRVRYEPVFDEDQIEEGLDDSAMNGPQAVEAADGATAQPQEVLKFENLHCDYVQREDLIHPKARTWEELPWLAYRAFLTRAQLVKRFGEKVGRKIPLEGQYDKKDGNGERGESASQKATVFEIWDKTNKEVLWVALGYPDIIDRSEPYLKMTGFFPSPRPAYGTLTNDSLEPIPDFIYYQDQLSEINDLTTRIGALTQALKLVGFYPAGTDGSSSPQIERAMKPGVENTMIAVMDWEKFTTSGREGVPISWLPVDIVEKLLRACVELRRQLIEDVREITGISDLMRGQTDPDETAKAQGLKAQYSLSRVKDRREELARLARDVVSMIGEIVAEQFQIATIMEISDIQLPTQQDVAEQQQQYQGLMRQWQQAAAQAQSQGQQPPPQPQPPPDPGPTVEDVEGFLRNGVMRRFRLDIETDSTVAADEIQQQQTRTQFVQSVSEFITAWGPIIQQSPALAPVAAQLLLFAVRAFPVARELENVIEEALDQIQKMAANPQPPQPSPDEQIKLQTAQIKGQAEQQKAETEVYATKVKAQAETQKAQLDATAAARSHLMDMEKMAAQHSNNMHTLNQQVQIAEQRQEAKDAVAFLHPKHVFPNGGAQ